MVLFQFLLFSWEYGCSVCVCVPVCVCVGGHGSAEWLVVCLAFYSCSLVFIDSPIRLFTLQQLHDGEHAAAAAESLCRINTHSDHSCAEEAAPPGLLHSIRYEAVGF